MGQGLGAGIEGLEKARTPAVPAQEGGPRKLARSAAVQELQGVQEVWTFVFRSTRRPGTKLRCLWAMSEEKHPW